MGVRLTRQDDERARERERLYGLLPLSFRCSLTRKWFMEIKRGGGSVREGRSKKSGGEGGNKSCSLFVGMHHPPALKRRSP